MIARGMESPLYRKQPSGPSGPTNNKAEANTDYKPCKSKESQMRTPEEVIKNDEDRFKHDKQNEVMMADAYILFEDKFIELLSNFVSMWHGHLG